MIHNQTKSSHM